jgi:hypothetical protein
LAVKGPVLKVGEEKEVGDEVEGIRGHHNNDVTKMEAHERERTRLERLCPPNFEGEVQPA